MFIDHFKNISRKAARIVHEPRLRGLRAGVAAAPLDPEPIGHWPPGLPGPGGYSPPMRRLDRRRY